MMLDGAAGSYVGQKPLRWRVGMSPANRDGHDGALPTNIKSCEHV